MKRFYFKLLNFIFIFFVSTCVPDEMDPDPATAPIGLSSELVEGVSVITGQVCCCTKDLVVAGVEPILIIRANGIPLRHVRAYCEIQGENFAKTQMYEIDGTCFSYKRERENRKWRWHNYDIDGVKWVRFDLDTDLSCSERVSSALHNHANSYILIDKEKKKFLNYYKADGTVRKYKKVHKRKEYGSFIFQIFWEKLPN